MRLARRDSHLPQHRELEGTTHEQLGDQALIDEHDSEDRTHQSVNECAAKRVSRIDASLQPDPKSIKAPGSCPSHQRSEYNRIDYSSERAEALFIVVASEEPNTFCGRHIFPIAASLQDERD
jgi:hypothetical protein